MRDMSDEELEVAATNATRILLGPFDRFETAEDFIKAYSAALLAHGQKVGNTDYARHIGNAPDGLITTRGMARFDWTAGVSCPSFPAPVVVTFTSIGG
ncbi:MAG: hypothetical protein ACM36C_12420 [Acidobacteriota bacterium]